MRLYAAIASGRPRESRPEHRRRIVETAHARAHKPRANPGGDGQEGLGAALRPLRDARRREAVRAEKIGERRRRAVLGDHLLGMEVDRRRPDALAIVRKARSRPGEKPPASRRHRWRRLKTRP